MACDTCKKTTFVQKSRNVALKQTFTNNLVTILSRHNISVAICSNQNDFIASIFSYKSSVYADTLHIKKPQSLTFNDGYIAITADGKSHISNGKQNDLFLQFSNLSSHTINETNPHDLKITADKQLYFLNTQYSSISTIGLFSEFKNVWKPSFISEYEPETRCFLNGFAFRDDVPRYATSLSQSNTKDGWNASLENSGVLIDIENDTILEGLCCPNSPRWYNDNLYFLDSGRGKLCRVDFNGDDSTLENASVVDVGNIPSFGRGLDFVGNLAFIGISPVRRTQDTERLPIVQSIAATEAKALDATQALEELKTSLSTPYSSDNEKVIADDTAKEVVAKNALSALLTEANRCGLWIVDINRGESMAYYQVDNIDGINDVKILPARAQISTTTTQRGQRNVYRTPKKNYNV